jgi:hypothetical protein
VELIPDLERWLSELMKGQPREPRQYKLRCHPDVYLALREASDRKTSGEYRPPGSPPADPPAFGSASIIVVSHLGSGGWELYEDGELLRSGRLGGEHG